MDWSLVHEIFWKFFQFGCLSIGGYVTVLGDLQRYLVVEEEFLTPSEFSASLAIGQAAPGPNYLLVIVIGWLIAGPWGAAATFFGTTLPYLASAVWIARAGKRWANRPWLKAYKLGLSPIAIFLYMASGYIIIDDILSVPVALLAITVALLTWLTRIPMFAILVLCACVGMTGVL